MAVTARPLFLLLATLPALVVVGGARAQERCTGTLCDAYYGGSGESFDDKPAAPAAAPTPLTVPTMPSPSGVLGKLFGSGSATPRTATAAPAGSPAPGAAPQPASRSFVHLGGGGLLGEHQERCSGTLCDMYYGSSKTEAEEPAEQPAAEQTAASPGSAPAEAAPRGRMRRVTAEAEKPRCASPSADPWRCYR